MILLPLTGVEAPHLRQALSIALEAHDGRLDDLQVDMLRSIDARVLDHEERHVGASEARQ